MHESVKKKLCIAYVVCSTADIDAKTLDRTRQLDLLSKLRKELIRLVRMKESLSARQLDEVQEPKRTVDENKITNKLLHKKSEEEKVDMAVDVKADRAETQHTNVLG